ncbi:MAG: RNA 3'-terminal phosphate cyclase [Nitrososphaerota archaeon]|nr:RNA 3'-terminal phosphate cyclase [Candidatus Calditenuaceae archaeon]MDW8073374.1 RNA 3'-terminal phosphate cyclase [Nitrososphaerota archaeon]
MVKVVDGARGEGGGQILRYAVSTCALLGEELRVFNIRAKRSPPGLRPQHITAIKSVAEVCGGTVEGLKIGSSSIIFRPTRPRGGKYFFDTGTAGSAPLVLQSLLPVICFADGPCEVEIRGGTNNPMAPPVDYIQEVLAPALRMMGVEVRLELVRRGFYPRGQGVVRVETRPVKRLKPIEALDAKVEAIEVYAYSCNLPDHIVRRMAAAAESHLGRAGYRDITVRTEPLDREDPRNSLDPGTGILILARLSSGLSMGFDSLGERGVPAEEVARRAAEEALSQLSTGAPIDKHLADQLIIWMALADGESRIRTSAITSHTATGVDVVGSLTGAEFGVKEEGPKGALISCRGIGLRPS